MQWIALIPLLPAAAFAVLAPLSRPLRTRLRWVSVVACGLSLLLSLAAFAATLPGGADRVTYHSFLAIARIGTTPIGFGLLLDARSATMLLVVTVVGFCVQIYSNGYMHREDRQGWYFAVLSLFTAAMLSVVLADNYLMLYMAWEVMGLCSYLLIGFWHENEAPREASIKAFLTTRVGDVGLGLGLAVIWTLSGTFAYDAVFKSVGSWPQVMITVTALLLFLGAMGKSAQFPLHVWLPDAMAGPTPASALIHAATMVAAGVWLVLRSMPIFERSPAAMYVVLVIGGITTLLGGLLAVVQYDVKKVLAYSTISQLGLMFLAIGAGGSEAAFFHLVTHAFFKAPLFLAAGVIIHASHTQDMREMNGLARATPLTAVAFSIGTLALMGVPPLSGFFSKDDMLTSMLAHGHYVAFAVGLIGAVLTAFYMARLWFRIFPGAGDGAPPNEGHGSMVWATMTLAIVTVVLGLGAPALATYLTGRWDGIDLAVSAAAVSFALAGIAAGWFVYGRRDAAGHRVFSTEPFKHNYVYPAMVNKFYIDAFYESLVIGPYMRVCAWLAEVFDPSVVDGAVNRAGRAWDRISQAASDVDISFIDGAVNGVAALVTAAGARVRKIQGGQVQTYQRLILTALIILLVWAVWRGA